MSRLYRFFAVCAALGILLGACMLPAAADETGVADALTLKQQVSELTQKQDGKYYADVQLSVENTNQTTAVCVAFDCNTVLQSFILNHPDTVTNEVVPNASDADKATLQSYFSMINSIEKGDTRAVGMLQDIITTAKEASAGKVLLSVVGFGNQTCELLPPTDLSTVTDAAALTASIETEAYHFMSKLCTAGDIGCNLQLGLRAGYGKLNELCASYNIPKSSAYLYLITDGAADTWCNPSDATAAAKSVCTAREDVATVQYSDGLGYSLHRIYYANQDNALISGFFTTLGALLSTVNNKKNEINAKSGTAYPDITVTEGTGIARTPQEYVFACATPAETADWTGCGKRYYGFNTATLSAYKITEADCEGVEGTAKATSRIIKRLERNGVSLADYYSFDFGAFFENEAAGLAAAPGKGAYSLTEIAAFTDADTTKVYTRDEQYGVEGDGKTGTADYPYTDTERAGYYAAKELQKVAADYTVAVCGYSTKTVYDYSTAETAEGQKELTEDVVQRQNFATGLLAWMGSQSNCRSLNYTTAADWQSSLKDERDRFAAGMHYTAEALSLSAELGFAEQVYDFDFVSEPSTIKLVLNGVECSTTAATPTGSETYRYLFSCGGTGVFNLFYYAGVEEQWQLVPTQAGNLSRLQFSFQVQSGNTAQSLQNVTPLRNAKVTVNQTAQSFPASAPVSAALPQEDSSQQETASSSVKTVADVAAQISAACPTHNADYSELYSVYASAYTTGGTTEQATAADGSVVIAAVPEKGYVFTGWSLRGDYTVIYDHFTFNEADEITAYEKSAQDDLSSTFLVVAAKSSATENVYAFANFKKDNGSLLSALIGSPDTSDLVFFGGAFVVIVILGLSAVAFWYRSREKKKAAEPNNR